MTATKIYERRSHYFANFSRIHSGRKTTVTVGWKSLKFDEFKRSKLNSSEIKKLVEKVKFNNVSDNGLLHRLLNFLQEYRRFFSLTNCPVLFSRPELAHQSDHF